MLKISVF